MVHIITERFLNKDGVTAEGYCNGILTGVTASPYLDKYQVRYDLMKDSRAKPANLLANQTSRAIQITKNVFSGQVRYKTAVLPTGCRDPITGVWGFPWWEIRTWYYGQQSTSPSLPIAPTPDWATPMRLQVADLKVNLGQDLAEYRQTSNMFKSTAYSAVNAWKRFKRKGGGRRKKLTPCSVSAANLVYSYGVAPLIGTLFDSYQVLQSTLNHPSVVKFVQTASETTHFDFDSIGQVNSVGSVSASDRAKAYVYYTRGKLGQFSLGNPASIAWELVPYSFVFDYMIPVGDALMALDALVGVDSIVGSVTRRERTELSQTMLPGGINGTIQSQTPSTMEMDKIKRDTFTSIPLPAFPKWSPSASWHKLRNAVALLHQTNRC